MDDTCRGAASDVDGVSKSKARTQSTLGPQPGTVWTELRLLSRRPGVGLSDRLRPLWKTSRLSRRRWTPGQAPSKATAAGWSLRSFKQHSAMHPAMTDFPVGR